MTGQQDFLLENTETFLGERNLGQPITIIHRGLCGPTHAECGLYVPGTPIKEATQCRPIANRFERKLLKWGAGDDQSVQIRRFTLLQGNAPALVELQKRLQKLVFLIAANAYALALGQLAVAVTAPQQPRVSIARHPSPPIYLNLSLIVSYDVWQYLILSCG